VTARLGEAQRRDQAIEVFLSVVALRDTCKAATILADKQESHGSHRGIRQGREERHVRYEPYLRSREAPMTA
jgi:hypothetical protein